MLWLILLVLIVIAIGGGIIVSKFLFLVLFAVVLFAVFKRISGSSAT